MMRYLALCFALAGCVDADGAPDAPNQLSGDDKADGQLWAGLTSVTIERYSSDPCNNGRNALGDDPIVYEEWARTRAAIRNVCFEVWKPGVTDWDNPDYWRQLDVKVHYRFGTNGPFTSEYVNAIDRRGNNRRYAWSFANDPLVVTGSVATIGVPFEIKSEHNGYAYVAAPMQFYFTVNGQTLKAPSNQPFVVRYENYARIPTLASNANGYVLHDIVTCEQGAARFGSGAGYFVADIRSASAVAAFQGSLIFGVPTAVSPSLVSFTYSNQNTVAGQALPGFSESRGLTITPDGSSMKVEMAIYDRASKQTSTLARTFTSCVKTN